MAQMQQCTVKAYVNQCKVKNSDISEPITASSIYSVIFIVVQCWNICNFM